MGFYQGEGDISSHSCHSICEWRAVVGDIFSDHLLVLSVAIIGTHCPSFKQKQYMMRHTCLPFHILSPCQTQAWLHLILVTPEQDYQCFFFIFPSLLLTTRLHLYTKSFCKMDMAVQAYNSGTREVKGRRSIKANMGQDPVMEKQVREQTSTNSMPMDRKGLQPTLSTGHRGFSHRRAK